MKIYLIKTDSKFLLDEKIKEIVPKNANYITYCYPENSIQDILEEASYVSLFLEEKYLIVKNATFFGKGKINEKDTELLLKYLEHPYPNTTVIFTTYEDIDKRKSITKKLLESEKYILLEAPKNYDLFLEIKKRLGKYQLDDNGVRYLIDACLSNYDILIEEIEKLSLLFQKKEKITLDALKQIVVPNISDNVFKFVDAVIKKDAYTTFHLLEEFAIIKTDVLQLMNMVSREYRLIYYYKILEKKCMSSKEMASELKLQDWQVEKIRKEASSYHEDDLKDHLIELSKIDFGIKSGREEKNVAFINFLMKILEY